jgi:hypothetical protein
MNRTIAFIDTAIGNVKAGRDHLRHDTDVMPSDLSSVVSSLRELVWNLDTITTVLIDAYSRQQDLGHDNTDVDPGEAVERILERLNHIRGLLDGVDCTLGDAHNIAAKLHRR